MNALRTLLYRILRKSETYTKTDMVYLASGGFWLVAGQGAAAVTSFVFSLAVARYLSPETYGTYKYILSIVAIIGAFSLTGLGTTIVRAVARGFDTALVRGFRTSLLWSAPMLLGFLGVSGYYWWKGANDIGAALLIAGLATMLINAATLFNAYWNGKKDFYRQTLFWTIVNVTATGATIIAILLTDNLLTLVATYFITSAIVHFILYLSIAHRIAQTATDEEPDKSEEGVVHLSILNFLNTIAANIDKIIVFQMLGTLQLAIYSFALALPDQLRAIFKSGARLALPRFVERKLDDIQSTLGDRLLRFGVLILGTAVLYMVAAPYIFQLLFPTYMASVPYSQLLALTLLTTLGAVPLAALQAHAKHRELYIHSITTNLIQIVSGIILMFYFGLWGAVISVLLNRTLNFALSFALLKRS